MKKIFILCLLFITTVLSSDTQELISSSTQEQINYDVQEQTNSSAQAHIISDTQEKVDPNTKEKIGSNTKEHMRYMQNIANKTNAKINKLKDLPRRTTHISHIEVEENYTLHILFETNFTDKHKVDNFRNINEIKMKQKFCRDNFYERMKDGFTIKFSYYTPKNELITYFELEEEGCKEANTIYSSIRFNPK